MCGLNLAIPVHKFNRCQKGGFMKKALSVLIGCLVATVFGEAQVARLGTPILAGTGCPQGSVSVALTEDASTISILFSSFTTSHSAASGRSVSQLALSCRIQIPVEVPAGYAMDLMKLEYRGFYAVPTRTNFFTLETKALSVGKYQIHPPQITRVTGPIASDYQIVHNLHRPMRSACGQAFNLDFTINMSVQGPMGRGWIRPLEGDAMASLDSLDSSGHNDGAGAYLGVALKPCSR